jgi:nucleoside-triphosphatase THEP1
MGMQPKSGCEHALLLTGPPGIGNTIVIGRVAEALEARRLSGFLTEEA